MLDIFIISFADVFFYNKSQNCWFSTDWKSNLIQHIFTLCICIFFFRLKCIVLTVFKGIKLVFSIVQDWYGTKIIFISRVYFSILLLKGKKVWHLTKNNLKYAEFLFLYIKNGNYKQLSTLPGSRVWMLSEAPR